MLPSHAPTQAAVATTIEAKASMEVFIYDVIPGLTLAFSLEESLDNTVEPHPPSSIAMEKLAENKPMEEKAEKKPKAEKGKKKAKKGVEMYKI